MNKEININQTNTRIQTVKQRNDEGGKYWIKCGGSVDDLERLVDEMTCLHVEWDVKLLSYSVAQSR